MRSVGLLELMESRRDNMRVAIKTPVEQVDVNVWDELQIDDTDLDTEFMALPGQIAYWTAVAARFTQAVEAIQRDYDNWYAPVYDKEFAKLEGATGRRPNISSAEYLVKISHKEEYNRRKDILDQAQTDLKIVQGIVPALQTKLQALMQLAKSKLAEYNSTDVGYRGGGMLPTHSIAPATPTTSTTPIASFRKPEGAAVDEARSSLREMLRK